jgi:deoxyhypusine synthase
MSTEVSARTIKGPDFNSDGPLTLKDFLEFYNSVNKTTSIGGQTSNLEKSIEIINEILAQRNTENPPTLFLGITSNVISCGLRETIAFLCKHKLIDAIVCTGGGIEEDFMKTEHPSYVMEYQVDDNKWRTEGKNRIGNMLVTITSYEAFDEYLEPVLERLYNELLEYEDNGKVDPNYRYPTPSSQNPTTTGAPKTTSQFSVQPSLTQESVTAFTSTGSRNQEWLST